MIFLQLHIQQWTCLFFFPPIIPSKKFVCNTLTNLYVTLLHVAFMIYNDNQYSIAVQSPPVLQQLYIVYSTSILVEKQLITILISNGWLCSLLFEKVKLIVCLFLSDLIEVISQTQAHCSLIIAILDYQSITLFSSHNHGLQNLMTVGNVKVKFQDYYTLFLNYNHLLNLLQDLLF